jgi:hypothetical protein
VLCHSINIHSLVLIATCEFYSLQSVRLMLTLKDSKLAIDWSDLPDFRFLASPTRNFLIYIC